MEKQKNARKYQRLLESAIELFSAHGYKNLSVEEIAASAGISKVTLYKYFPSKEDLFLSCLKILTDRHYEQMKEVIAGKHRAAEKISELFRFNLTQRGRYAEVFIRDMMGTVHIWKEIGPYRARLARSVISDILEEGVRNGEFHIRSIPHTIELLMSFKDVIASVYPFHNPQEEELFLENLYAFLTGALTCQAI